MDGGYSGRVNVTQREEDLVGYEAYLIKGQVLHVKSAGRCHISGVNHSAQIIVVQRRNHVDEHCVR